MLGNNEIVSCVVVETIFKKDNDFINSIVKKFQQNNVGANISNHYYLNKCPLNSIIVKISNPERYMILYPFFSSHFSLPIKPGEHVWAFFPNGIGKTDIGYWMTRRATDYFIEDANFTHNTRSIYKNYFNVLVSEESSDISKSIYYGVNGRGFNGYSNLVKNTEGNISHNFEKIERIDKKPSDLLIQGSNNSHLLFTSGNEKETGTIIMTVGRGKTETTSAEIIENLSSLEESNKASDLSKIGKMNENEGKLDINSDKAIFVLSENPSFIKKNSVVEIEDEIEEDMSMFFIKADQIRNIARQKIKIYSPEIYSKSEKFIVESNEMGIISDKIGMTTSGWNVMMSDIFDVLESLIQEVANVTSGVSPFTTGVGPTGPAVNAANLQSLLAKIKSMKG